MVKNYIFIFFFVLFLVFMCAFDIDKKITFVLNKLLKRDMRLDKYLRCKFKNYQSYIYIKAINPKEPKLKLFSAGEISDLENDYIFIEANFIEDNQIIKRKLIIEFNFFIIFNKIYTLEDW